MGEEFITVEDGERSTVLDAMALLGGNEYLVQQMVEADPPPALPFSEGVPPALQKLVEIFDSDPLVGGVGGGWVE